VYESGGQLDYVCFPTSCVVSLIYSMEDGAVVEMSLVCSDGMMGVAIFMGGNTMPNRAVVQLVGPALRMKAIKLQDEFRRGADLQRLLLRYSQTLITQISQTAVCNRLHSVEQSLSRWLLLCHDRAGSDELMMTQEFISNMLGGRRQSVNGCSGPAAGWGIDSVFTGPHHNPRPIGWRTAYVSAIKS
jgi:hypothetical protein